MFVLKRLDKENYYLGNGFIGRTTSLLNFRYLSDTSFSRSKLFQNRPASELLAKYLPAFTYLILQADRYFIF